MHPLILALLIAPQAPSTSALEAELVITGGLLFDGMTDELRPNPGILVRAGRIVAIGPDAATGAARVLALEGEQTVLPGLIDLHAHYAVDLMGRGRVEETEFNPLIFLGNGVTSTFPAGEVQPERLAALKAAIEVGERPGPRIFRSGPYFGRWRRGWDEGIAPEALVAEIDHWAEQGVHCFKAKGISPEHLRILIERAHHHGLSVTGHLDSGYRSTVNPKDAILWGIDRVEHFLGGDALPAEYPAYSSLEKIDPDCAELAAVAALYVEHEVHFDTTLTAFGYYAERDPEVFAYWTDEREFFTPWLRAELAARAPREPMAQFERIYRVKHETLGALVAAGGAHLITVGTDHPSGGEFLAGFGMHRELHALTRAGLTPAQALRCATINAARALDVADELGTVELGKRADLCIVAGDPLADIRATRSVLHVVKDGRLYDAPELLARARGRIGPAQADEVEAWMPPRRR